MRRPLALLAAVIALMAAPARAGEPYDLDLTRLGPPGENVWLAQQGCLTAAGSTCTPLQQADAQAMASDARVRFARLTTDLALAFTSSLLQPASTTGHSGFNFDLEASYTQVHHEVLGGETATFGPPTYGGVDYWPTHTQKPTGLLMPSLHMRKSLPFSFEVGGRVTYMSQSSYFAAQLEGKWALLEGYAVWPEVALRAAYTKVLGVRDLELGVTEFDVMTSKRFGLNAVTSVTPYLALRLARLSASTPVLNFRPDMPPASQADLANNSAAFPDVKSSLYRTTLGARLTAGAVSLGLEATYYGGGTKGSGSAGADYPKYATPSSLAGAFKFGFEF